MTQVKSPYNFVPLNTRVFSPYWSKFVSHDVPFKDGLSGKIKLKIKTNTPIFIRGEKKVENGNDVYHFFKHNNKYCIPGTSIKGEIENVMEVISFGKLRFVNENERFGVRDMTDRQNLVGQAKKCGFLIKTTDGFRIHDCGNIVRIDYHNISVSKGENIRGLSAIDKYNRITNRNINVNIRNSSFNLQNGIISFKKAIVGEEYSGELVFTNDFRGKQFEFVFIKNNNTITVDAETVRDFENIYFSGKSDYDKIWSNDFRNGNPIPIFYTQQGDNLKIGFTTMYKLLYNNSINELIYNNFPELFSSNIDLTECIFGYSDEHNNEKLKGRVNIEPAYTNSATELNTVTTILGSPKASYYPFYIKQSTDNNNNITTGRYKTYMHNDAELAGRKRYPVKEKEISYNPDGNGENVEVKFKPLPKNTEFTTTIHYHNLLSVELGALLSALTFHNTEECHHSLGMAKPLGYGNVTFEIDFGKSDIDSVASLKYMCMFEKMMDGFYKQEIDKNKEWIKSEQLKELFTMAKPLPSNHPKFTKLKYMILDDFARLKKRGNPSKALPRYSKFIDFEIEPKKIGVDCTFNIEEDKKVFILKISNDKIRLNINYYKKRKIQENTKNIDNLLKDIENKIDIEKKKLQKEKENIAKQKKHEKIKAFKEQGIKLLTEQKKLKLLISKKRTWANNYYGKNIPEDKLIPDEYLNDFLKYINSLFESNRKDKNWRHKKDYKKSNGYKLLKECIGEDNTKKWFNEKELIN